MFSLPLMTKIMQEFGLHQQTAIVKHFLIAKHNNDYFVDSQKHVGNILSYVKSIYCCDEFILLDLSTNSARKVICAMNYSNERILSTETFKNWRCQLVWMAIKFAERPIWR